MPPASLASSTSRGRQRREPRQLRASMARAPSRPPRRETTWIYGRKASCSAFASATSSPMIVASAVGPVEHRLELGSCRPRRRRSSAGGSWRCAAARRCVAQRPSHRLHLGDLQAPVIGHGHARSCSGAAPPARRTAWRFASVGIGCCPLAPPWHHENGPRARARAVQRGPLQVVSCLGVPPARGRRLARGSHPGTSRSVAALRLSPMSLVCRILP